MAMAAHSAVLISEKPFPSSSSSSSSLRNKPFLGFSLSKPAFHSKTPLFTICCQAQDTKSAVIPPEQQWMFDDLTGPVSSLSLLFSTKPISSELLLWWKWFSANGNGDNLSIFSYSVWVRFVAGFMIACTAIWTSKLPFCVFFACKRLLLISVYLWGFFQEGNWGNCCCVACLLCSFTNQMFCTPIS